MKKGWIRWLFILLMVAFLGITKYVNLLYRSQNWFLVLLLLFSGITVFGIFRFRDPDTEEPEDGIESEADILLKKIQAETENEANENA